MVGACIMPCRASAAQGVAVRGAGSRPGEGAGAGVPGIGATRPAGVPGCPAAVAVLWRPDSDRHACLSVLDST